MAKRVRSTGFMAGMPNPFAKMSRRFFPKNAALQAGYFKRLKCYEFPIHSISLPTIMTRPQRPTRRRFVQGIAAAGAATILIPKTGRAVGYQSPNDRPVFATIGLRNQGWEIVTL